MIVSMQLGFAMLEVGCVRQEHRMTVLDTWLQSQDVKQMCPVLHGVT